MLCITINITTLQSFTDMWHTIRSEVQSRGAAYRTLKYSSRGEVAGVAACVMCCRCRCRCCRRCRRRRRRRRRRCHWHHTTASGAAAALPAVCMSWPTAMTLTNRRLLLLVLLSSFSDPHQTLRACRRGPNQGAAGSPREAPALVPSDAVLGERDGAGDRCRRRRRERRWEFLFRAAASKRRQRRGRPASAQERVAGAGARPAIAAIARPVLIRWGNTRSWYRRQRQRRRCWRRRQRRRSGWRRRRRRLTQR